MKQLSHKGLVFFVLGIMLCLVFRNSTGMIAGAGFLVVGIILIVRMGIKPDKD